MRTQKPKNHKTKQPSPKSEFDRVVFDFPRPIVLFLEYGDGTTSFLIPRPSRHEEYGLMACDLVRNLARAFEVDEKRMWEWIEIERRKRTTLIATGDLAERHPPLPNERASKRR